MKQQINVKVLNGEEIGNPEVLAMLQAFYSRSPMAIDERLRSLQGDSAETNIVKIKAALKRYYFDYGHASIADCGTSTTFIENVSMLAAKVIQDDPLYNGQECSTRYLDFSRQEFICPAGGEAFQPILEEWRGLYLRALPLLKEWARDTYRPEDVLSAKIPGDKVQDAFGKTCDAIAFDVARGLLPCGAATSLSWSASLRRTSDRLNELSRYPLAEVREIGRIVHRRQYDKHPGSFAEPDAYQKDTLERSRAPDYWFYNIENLPEGVELVSTWFPEGEAKAMIGCDTPGKEIRGRHWTDDLAYFCIVAPLDFASSRDVLRHRNGVNKLPMVYVNSEYHPFYTETLNKVDPSISRTARELSNHIGRSTLPETSQQYFAPMMTMVPVHFKWNLGQLRYVLRLRTSTSVHPTLRKLMKEVHEVVLKEHASWITTTLDVVNTRPDYESSDRGEQTVKER